MKILGFMDQGDPVPPGSPGRPAPGGLRDEDPAAYRELIEGLTESSPRRDQLRRTLLREDGFVVLTGQQPALLGGPLYTLYKVLTAVEQARRVRLRGGSAVAAFWCVGDDTDFGEVSHATWPLRDGAPRRVRIEGVGTSERIGGLDATRMRDAIASLQADHPGSPGLRLLEEVIDRSLTSDWSAFLRESLAALTGDEPLLFVDGNAPAVVRAGQQFLRRFVQERSALAVALEGEADAARARGEEPPLGAEEGGRCLFLLEGSGRRVLPADERPGGDAALAPNVVLRPALQEHLLPVGRVVCGDAEIAYRRLLGPVYERAGRIAAPLMRRFGATLLPPPWSSDAPDPEAAVTDPDGLIERWSVQFLPAEGVSRVLAVREEVRRSLADLEEPLDRVDRNLSQLLASVRGKVDFQIGRVEEGVRAKARQVLYRRHPVLAHLREFVVPRGRPQERSFCLWTPLVWDGPAAGATVAEGVAAWFDRGERGHALMALEGEGPDS